MEEALRSEHTGLHTEQQERGWSTAMEGKRCRYEVGEGSHRPW